MEDAIRFLILSDARSGTMLLTDAIDEHQCVKFYNLYASNPDNPKGHYDNWRAFQRQEEEGITHRGTTMHRVGDGWITTLGHTEPRHFWNDIAQQNRKCISLRRENLLRRLLSIKVGVLLKSYKVDRPRTEDPRPVLIPVQELMKFIGDTELLHERIDGHFPYRLEITYEQLAWDWPSTFWRIQEYLGLPQTGIEPVTFLQEKRPLAEAIQNYEEIEFYLTNQNLKEWLL